MFDNILEDLIKIPYEQIKAGESGMTVGKNPANFRICYNIVKQYIDMYKKDLELKQLREKLANSKR